VVGREELPLYVLYYFKALLPYVSTEELHNTIAYCNMVILLLIKFINVDPCPGISTAGKEATLCVYAYFYFYLNYLVLCGSYNILSAHILK